MKINTPISIGEFLDKISILWIKSQKIKNKEKNKEILKEYYSLMDVAIDHIAPNFQQWEVWVQKLIEVNIKLWVVEDNIRIKEKNKEFDEEFIRLAREVYITNDQRFAVKNEINDLTNSDFKERKSYEEY